MVFGGGGDLNGVSILSRFVLNGVTVSLLTQTTQSLHKAVKRFLIVY